MLLIASPIYKARDTLPDLLNSLVAQTNHKFLYMPVIDADGEDYSDIWATYEARGLRIFPKQLEVNGGPGMARQYAIDNAGNCDYITFIDADDMLLPRAVEMMYRSAKRTDADVISCAFIRETNQTDIAAIMTPSKDNTTTWTHGKCYKVSYLQSNDIRFLPEFRLNEDAYFNCVAINMSTNTYRFDEPVYIWRYKATSLTHEQNYIDFVRKSGDGYMVTQLRALKFLEDHNSPKLSVGLLLGSLVNAYKEWNILNSYNEPCPNFEVEAAAYSQSAYLQEALKSEEFWDSQPSLLPACENIEGTLFYYRTTFIDWLKQYKLLSEDTIQ